MIASAYQRSEGLIYVVDEKGTTRTVAGRLIGYTSTNLTYSSTPQSRIQYVLDENLRHVRTICL